MIDRVRLHEAVLRGDFNVPGNNKSLVERMVSKRHARSKLHIPFVTGEIKLHVGEAFASGYGNR